MRITLIVGKRFARLFARAAAPDGAVGVMLGLIETLG
jgi:hypothetical protein